MFRCGKGDADFGCSRGIGRAGTSRSHLCADHGDGYYDEFNRLFAKAVPASFTTKNSIVSSDIEAPVDFTTGPNPVAVAVADLNGDGTPDIVSANATGASVSVLLNNSNNLSGISAATLSKQDFVVDANPSNVIIGDFNEDGKQDLAVVYQTNSWVTILTNTTPAGGALSFAAPVSYPCSGNANAIATGDLDKDGRRDLVIANFGMNTVFLVWPRSRPSAAARRSASVKY